MLSQNVNSSRLAPQAANNHNEILGGIYLSNVVIIVVLKGDFKAWVDLDTSEH